ncbi:MULTISPECIES: hypothetical protein [unclassified Nocardioides]|uniref:hypothetical protein n=1 Tax=unclassified Nocardioides TaxID=2615069 RepID=UPI000A81BEFD|nr:MULTISPECIES: hypothetical protein [unclassified Nocardioides]
MGEGQLLADAILGPGQVEAVSDPEAAMLVRLGQDGAGGLVARAPAADARGPGTGD